MAEFDYKRKLVDYFKKNLKKGYTPDTLKYSLVSQGYSRPVIEDALAIANKELSVKAPVIKEKPIIRHQLIDEENNVIEIERKKSWWKRVFG